METETDNSLGFLDVLINNKDPTDLITSAYRKRTFTGLLTTFFSFTSFSYKLGLITTLLDRTYKITSTFLGFNEEVKKLSYTLKKNQFLEGLINKVVNRYLDKVNASTALPVNSKPPEGLCTLYFQLPYLALSNFVQRTLPFKTCWHDSIKE